MRARSVHGARLATAAAVAVLVLVGCDGGSGDAESAGDGGEEGAGADGGPDGAGEATSASPSPSGPDTAGASADPPPEPEPAETYHPPALSWVPPDEELDRMALEVEAAYVEYWAAYDAAASTGFTDVELLDTLLATAGEDTLEALHTQVAAIGDIGRVVEGRTEVLGVEVVALSPPVEDGPGLALHLDACVHMKGVLIEPDGTVVRELAGGDPELVRARLTDHDGEWILVSQVQQTPPCPELLRGEAG